MKTALFLLVLTLIFGFAATWILEIRLTSSHRRAHRLKQTSGALRRSIPARRKSRRRGTLRAGAHGKSGARRAARTGGLRRIRSQRVEAVIERPVPAGPPKSRAGAASKLVIVIFVYGVGMAILTLVLLRWVGAILRQASA